MDIPVSQKTINPETLAAEMTAAIGAAWQGWSTGKAWPGVVRLHFADGTAQAAIDAALAVYAAHNPAVLTPAQTLAARRVTAEGDLQAADFAAVLAQINAATSLADAKPILKKLLALTYRLALAQGMTDKTDPGA
jgi:hypothetical protein